VVEKAFPKEDRVLVSGVNVRKVHQKPTRTNAKGQTIEKSLPIHVSNVKLATKTSKKKN
jgi:large subunit ribosomal protein L24